MFLIIRVSQLFLHSPPHHYPGYSRIRSLFYLTKASLLQTFKLNCNCSGSIIFIIIIIIIIIVSSCGIIIIIIIISSSSSSSSSRYLC